LKWCDHIWKHYPYLDCVSAYSVLKISPRVAKGSVQRSRVPFKVPFYLKFQKVEKGQSTFTGLVRVQNPIKDFIVGLLRQHQQ
jgi:hypothetical protein